MSALRTVGALTAREMLKFVRDRSRVLGALAQPLALWLLLGLGFQNTFQPPGGDVAGSYVAFLFPGILALVLLFTAIFSTISIVEERASGFLQAVLVAPTPRTALVFGTTLGGTLLATVQALLFLGALPFVALTPGWLGVGMVVAICLLTGLAFTALGFAIAWEMDTTRGFHAVMNLFLLPMWFLSGAFFPAASVPAVLRWVMYANPAFYGVAAIRQGLYLPAEAPGVEIPLALSLGVSVAFAAAVLALAVWTVRRPLFGS